MKPIIAESSLDGQPTATTARSPSIVIVISHRQRGSIATSRVSGQQFDATPTTSRLKVIGVAIQYSPGMGTSSDRMRMFGGIVLCVIDIVVVVVVMVVLMRRRNQERLRTGILAMVGWG